LSFFSGGNFGSIDTANQFRADTTKPKTQAFRDNFTTAQIRIDTAQRMAMRYIKLVIDNQDPTNSLQFRTDPDAQQLTVPANSVVIVEDEIHDYLEINPNGATGVGNFSMTLADPMELRAKGFLGAG